MSTITSPELKPATAINTLIIEFDKLLSGAGLQTTSLSYALDTSKEGNQFFKQISSSMESQSYSKLLKKYDSVVDIVAEIVSILEDDVTFSELTLPELPVIDHNSIANLKSFVEYVKKVKKTVQPLIDQENRSSKNQKFFALIQQKKSDLNKGFYYEFTDGDIKRIQLLVNELRDEISSSNLFNDEHRQRLLRRLETMQSEIHKKMSDVDRIWGLVGDAGVVIGKFGKDAKPIVDRIKELSKIAWRTQARAEELPSDSSNPLIGNDNQDE